MSGEVNQRNAIALEQANRDLTERVLAQQIRIDGLVATMSSMQERMSALETQLNHMRAAAAGRGPSV